MSNKHGFFYVAWNNEHLTLQDGKFAETRHALEFKYVLRLLALPWL